MCRETKPLVSIFCLVYNHEDYIRECLDGILSQECAVRYEVVVHDDASTDSSASIIKEYQAKFPEVIRPIFQSENQYRKIGFNGIIKLMNSHCSGRYAAFCEGDDYWTDPRKLQKQVDFLESHPDYSMCFHNAERKYEIQLEERYDFVQIENRDYQIRELVDEWIVPTASMVFKRHVFDRMSYDSRIINTDINCVLACSHSGKIRGMSEFMSVYRIQASGITRQRVTALTESYYFKCLDHYRALYDEYPKMSYFSYSMKAVHIYVSLASFYKNRKKHVHMLYFLLKAFITDPYRAVIRLKHSIK